MATKNKLKNESGENPLVPNARLRTIYTTMLEARAIEELVTRRRRSAPRGGKLASIHGEEAVRASIVLQLGDDDLVSDGDLSAGMVSILGADARSLLKAFGTPKEEIPVVSRLLPAIAGTEQRLQMALGSSLAIKAQGRQGVVISYIRKDDLSPAAYRHILSLAAANQLPVIFVVLPRSGARKAGDSEAKVAKIASRSGVPGIPVDACDSVALYRVAQESLGRARGGDGPVLIECVGWKPAGRRNLAEPADPIEHLRHFLLGRKISTSAWLKQAETAALKRLKAK
jgi:TPP-dependent pyruvate/acetoin dehydrogenase alpha subunit